MSVCLKELPYIYCVCVELVQYLLRIYAADLDSPFIFLFYHFFCSRVVFLCVFIPALFPYFLQVHPYLKLGKIVSEKTSFQVGMDL